MSQTPIEELARMSAAEGVRRNFDERNTRMIAAPLFLSALFAVIYLIGISVAGRVTQKRLIVIAADLLLVFLCTWALEPRRRRSGEQRRRVNVRAWTIGYLAAQLVLVEVMTAGSETMVAMAAMFLLGMIFFRFSPLEHASLFGFVFLSAWIVAVLMPNAKNPRLGEVLGPVGGVGGFSLVVSLILSYSARRGFLRTFVDDQRRAREEVRMRGELALAREVQLSMLPLSAPQLDWVDLAGVSIPATEVGGDYYDYFVLGDGSVAIVSGDVAGHGMASGIVLAAVRAGLTLLRDTLRDAPTVLARLDQLILDTSSRRTLVSAAILLLDRTSMRLTFASAGHPPLLIRRDGEVELVELHSPPLGVRLPHGRPAHRELPLVAGDALVLYSDGVYETRTADGEPYGFERLAALVRDNGDTTAAGLRDAITRDVERYRGPTEQADDVTVVVAKMRVSS
ncbi:MAG TPA: PP2C family protein-serine/threonine phosphatase [Thermoanaerobaculia bacterium]|jgi:serine phosphatase RsbU (regulator of sigma subunit)|nr:PP2C family protein-serine/threonine phosphatase [Thermoanaerobaculia bacterium]